MSKTLLN